MVKKKLIQILLISLCFIAGCGRCKDDKMSYCAMSNKIYEYSHMFREGSWWIYANQDSSKLDTMFVTEFKDTFQKDYSICIKNQLQTFKLHSKYFLGLDGSIINGSVFVNNCNQGEGLILERRDSLNNQSYYQYSSLTYGYNIPDSTNKSYIIVNRDTYQGIYGIYDKGVFSKEVGVLLYTNSTFNHDTFRLIKYHIQ